MSEAPAVEVEQAGAVRWLLLNRPQRLNAIDDRLLAALDQEIAAAAEDAGAEVIVLAGRGRSFCTGADLRHLLAVAERDGDPTAFLAEVSACVTRLGRCPKPVVAALHGHVVAGGLELALVCDVVVAAEGTLIGDGHVRNRLLPAAGSSVRLVPRVGMGLGRRLLLSGELLPAERFLASGWVQAVVAPDGLREHAEETVRALAATAGRRSATSRRCSPSSRISRRAKGSPPSCGPSPPTGGRPMYPPRSRPSSRPRSVMQRYDGRVVAVTGGAQGLGRAMARRFAAEGAAVALADLDGAGAEQACQELTAGSRARADAARIDVSISSEVQGWIDDVRRRLGRLDVLVNNAGIIRDNRIEQITDDDWRAVVDVNLTGAFHGIRAALPIMKAQRYGRILSFSSMSWRGNFGQANYVAAKAGIVGLTRGAALEAARDGITVNAIAPGLIETKMLAGMNARARDLLIGKIPVRHTGDPSDIAAAAAFLCSEEARYITGVVLDVHGGIGIGSSIR